MKMNLGHDQQLRLTHKREKQLWYNSWRELHSANYEGVLPKTKQQNKTKKQNLISLLDLMTTLQETQETEDYAKRCPANATSKSQTVETPRG